MHCFCFVSIRIQLQVGRIFALSLILLPEVLCSGTEKIVCVRISRLEVDSVLCPEVSRLVIAGLQIVLCDIQVLVFTVFVALELPHLS